MDQSYLAEADRAGVMVAVVPPGDLSIQLQDKAQEANPDLRVEPLDNMHITLAYLGGMDEVVSIEDVEFAVETFAMDTDPLRFEVAGWGRFDNNGQHVLYASVNVPGIEEWRTKLIDYLSQVDVEVKQDFSFTPHITVAYSDEQIESFPESLDTQRDWVAKEVILAKGGEWESYPLSQQFTLVADKVDNPFYDPALVEDFQFEVMNEINEAIGPKASLYDIDWPVEQFDPYEVVPTQSWLKEEKFRHGPIGPSGEAGPAVVIRWEGVPYLYDGHHRNYTFRAQGVPSMDAQVIDLDKPEAWHKLNELRKQKAASAPKVASEWEENPHEDPFLNALERWVWYTRKPGDMAIIKAEMEKRPHTTNQMLFRGMAVTDDPEWQEGDVLQDLSGGEILGQPGTGWSWTPDEEVAYFEFGNRGSQHTTYMLQLQPPASGVEINRVLPEHDWEGQDEWLIPGPFRVVRVREVSFSYMPFTTYGVAVDLEQLPASGKTASRDEDIENIYVEWKTAIQGDGEEWWDGEHGRIVGGCTDAAGLVEHDLGYEMEGGFIRSESGAVEPLSEWQDQPPYVQDKQSPPSGKPSYDPRELDRMDLDELDQVAMRGDMYEHYWNRKPDGTIVDITGEQLGGDTGPRIIPPDDPRQALYWTFPSWRGDGWYKVWRRPVAAAISLEITEHVYNMDEDPGENIDFEAWDGDEKIGGLYVTHNGEHGVVDYIGIDERFDAGIAKALVSHAKGWMDSERPGVDVTGWEKEPHFREDVGPWWEGRKIGAVRRPEYDDWLPEGLHCEVWGGKNNISPSVDWEVNALADEDDDLVGYLKAVYREGGYESQGYPDAAVIYSAYVIPDWRRRGVATGMLRILRDLYDPVEVVHNQELSDEGRQWAEMVGSSWRRHFDDVAEMSEADLLSEWSKLWRAIQGDPDGNALRDLVGHENMQTRIEEIEDELDRRDRRTSSNELHPRLREIAQEARENASCGLNDAPWCGDVAFTIDVQAFQDPDAPNAPVEQGEYRGPEGGERYGHYWNVLEDGSILDATADQFGRDPIVVYPPGSEGWSWYWPVTAETDEDGYPVVRPPGKTAMRNELFGIIYDDQELIKAPGTTYAPDDMPREPDEWARQPIEEIPPDVPLYATQPITETNRRAIEQSEPTDEPIRAVRKGGQTWVWDGHHRASVRRRLGLPVVAYVWTEGREASIWWREIDAESNELYNGVMA